MPGALDHGQVVTPCLETLSIEIPSFGDKIANWSVVPSSLSPSPWQDSSPGRAVLP